MIELRRLDSSGFAKFTSMTTAAYQVNYGDVDGTMARHILDSHVSGVDKTGYMTLRKEVFVIHWEDAAAGFTTLTWKRGGSVKTGPTILMPDYRGKGIGPMVQLEIQKHVAVAGGRKTYGTVSESNMIAQRYMLKAGYQIETRLKDHYYSGKNEVVFGKLLVPPGESVAGHNVRLCASIDGVTLHQAGRAEILAHSAALSTLFEKWLVAVDGILISNLSSAVDRGLREFSAKPKRVMLVCVKGALVGALVFAPKRGGAVKVNILGNLECGIVLETFALILPEFKTAGFRKCALFLPISLKALADSLPVRDWIHEGWIREPYKAGVDVGIFSRFL